MAKKPDPKPRPDKRKIPRLFRAVENDGSRIYYGFLISDSGEYFTCFACHDGDESQLKERVLEKKDFTFTKIDIDELDFQGGVALQRMKKEVNETTFELESRNFKLSASENFLKQIRSGNTDL